MRISLYVGVPSESVQSIYKSARVKEDAQERLPRPNLACCDFFGNSRDERRYPEQHACSSEGSFVVDEHLDRLNRLDCALEAAVREEWLYFLKSLSVNT